MWSRRRVPAASVSPVARLAAPLASAMVNASTAKAGKLERIFKARPLRNDAREFEATGFQIVPVVQELSTAGGVETVAGELARVFSRNNLPNVVLASSVG